MDPLIPGWDNDTQPWYDGMMPYDPDAPVPHWHQNLQMALVCIINGLSVIVIVARLYLRVFRLRRFEAEDKWMIAAGLLLIFPHFVSQIAFTIWGGGLHVWNVRYVWRPIGWNWSTGFAGYYLVASLIKVSIVCTILRVVPVFHKKTRWLLYCFAGIISSLGFAETMIWLMPCKPFLSNFVYTVWSESCINLDAPRYVWSSFSIVIDLLLVFIPWHLVHGLQQMRSNEKSTLYGLFGVNILATIACGVSIYGNYMNTDSAAAGFDETYTFFSWMICNDIEVLMYTLCSSISVLAPLFARKSMDRGAPPPPPVIVNLRNSSSRSEKSDGSKSDYKRQVSPIVSKRKKNDKKTSNSIFGWSQAMNDTVTNEKEEEEVIPLGQHESNLSKESRPNDIESGLSS